MNSPDSLDSVARFHETFQHPVLHKPTIPEKQRCDLRVSLIAEELEELKKAIEDCDITEIADALCDIQYVLSGAILEFGLGEKFKALFDEVQRSNMSKACKSEKEAQETVKYYKETRGINAHYISKDGHYLVFRDEDKKTLKSINYSPPNLQKILYDKD